MKGEVAGRRAAETGVIGAERPPAQVVRRGRAFVRVYVALVALATVAFVTLAVLARDQDVLGFDVAITHAIQGVHLPLYDWALRHESDLGFPPLNAVTYVAVFAAFFALRLRLEAALAVASSLLADGLGSAVKALVARPRPSGALVHVVAHLNGYSFPSGHVIQYTTLFGFTYYVVLATWRRSPWRNLVLIVLGLLVALVGPSRVYLGEHWPSDVLGAYLLAGLWLAGAVELHLYLKARLRGR